MFGPQINPGYRNLSGASVICDDKADTLCNGFLHVEQFIFILLEGYMLELDAAGGKTTRIVPEVFSIME